MTKDNSEFYICDVYLLLYETKAKAVIGEGGPYTAHLTEYCTSRYKYAEKNTPIFVVKKYGKYWHVIAGERIGWIIAEEWLGIKQLKRKHEEF
jgi:hypothetical protein